MKAVIFSRHGGVEVLQYTDVADPKLEAGDALVRVKACALNHLDIWTRQGMPGIKIPLPHILGCDIAGEVVKLGPKTKGPKPGTPVVVAPGTTSCNSCKWCDSGWDSLCSHYKILGFQLDGGYAEYAKVPAKNLIPVSDRCSMIEWAACPLVFLTAWHMLVTRAELKEGETVLIHAAGSGVGSAAIQVAKNIGARVITTVGDGWKGKRAAQLGADTVINYKEKDFAAECRKLTDGSGVDVVLEHIGVDTFTKSLTALAKKGRLVTCGVTSGAQIHVDLRFLFVHQYAVMGCYMGGRSELDEVMGELESGNLKPVVDRTFPLSEAGEAHRHMLGRGHFGKIVLQT